MKIPDNCMDCIGNRICVVRIDRGDRECTNFHNALESKLQSTPSTNTKRDVILAAGNEWYDRSHGGSLDGFIAGAEWALKQTPIL